MVFKIKKRRIVSIVSLEKDIAKEKKIIAKQEVKREAEVKRSRLAGELAQLRRRPSTSRNIILGKRIARGAKILGGKTARVLSKQAKLIRDQQLREEALLRRDIKKSSSSRKKSIKKQRKGRKKFIKKQRKGRKKFIKKTEKDGPLGGFNPIGELNF